MKNENRLRVSMLVAFTLMADCAISAPAANSEALRIEQLEVIVSNLEKRVTELETPSEEGTKIVPRVGSQAAWENISNWRSLKKGMSKGEVKKLLGEPEKIDASGPFENWNWNVPYGPRVTFYDEKLYAWREPD